jgi:hypothetical protein
MMDINGDPVAPNRDYDVSFRHFPLLFVQGETAYELIEMDEDRNEFIRALGDYLPDELPPAVEGEPPALNYRVDFRHQEGERNYRIGYTTGDGGCLTVDLIEELYIPID